VQIARADGRVYDEDDNVIGHYAVSGSAPVAVKTRARRVHPGNPTPYKQAAKMASTEAPKRKRGRPRKVAESELDAE